MSEETSKVRITVKGDAESYVFDRDSLDLNDLFAIKSASGLDFNPFLEGMNNAAPKALQTLVWFVRHKAGIQGDPLQVNFKIGDLDMAPIVEDEATDPTAASCGLADAPISDASPIISTSPPETSTV